ncbi:MAG: SET domain-containing protein [Patescibacteria group bacterium]|nr:SET domain-containing protein [Patescibacteria group bacterium]
MAKKKPTYPAAARPEPALARKRPEGVRVGRASAGLGLFATRPYKKGERVIEYVGRTLTNAEEYSSRSKYLFEVNKRKTIDGSMRSNIARYINHSCKPNCEPEIERGRIFIDAIRNIKEGEEFVYDYGEEYFNEHIKPYGCRCAKHT